MRNTWKGAREDCTHSCMPGPVDTYAALLFRQLAGHLHRRGSEDIGEQPEPSMAAAMLKHVHDLHHPPGNAGYFALPLAQWLDLNRGAKTGETNNSHSALECARCSPVCTPRERCPNLHLSAKKWWPFKC